MNQEPKGAEKRRDSQQTLSSCLILKEGPNGEGTRKTKWAEAYGRAYGTSGRVRESSLVYILPPPTKKRRRALRALFPAKSLKLRGLFLANKSKEASTCRREAAALTVRCLPRAQL